MAHKIQLPAKGNIVRINQRKCSDKQQPDITVGEKYIVQETEQLKDGTPVLLLVDWKSSRHGKSKIIRCNAKRFGWEIYTEGMAKEEYLKKTAKESYMELLHKFDFNEHMQIAYVPLIIIHCAWTYTDKVLDFCREHKIQDTRKLGRAVKLLHDEYDKDVMKDLDRSHREQVESSCKEFMEKFKYEFFVWEETIRRELNKNNPNDPYVDLRIYAFIGMLICEYYEEHNRRCDLLIGERLGGVHNTIANPKIVALRTCMEAYTGFVKINLAGQVRLCVQTFANNLRRVDFTTAHEERIKGTNF